ncbi:MAG: DUF1449 family protein [Pirellulaceae bacterium]|nr:DUF1449 family protein [Planctomycetales bacterium]
MTFLELAFGGVMLPITVLLLLVVAYWIAVLIGAIGLDLFDVDIDTEIEGDLDGGVGHGENSGGFLISSLKFFHFGEVPFMLLLSIFTLCWWVVTGIGAAFFASKFTGLWAIVWIGPCFLIGLLMTKGFLMPTSRFFRALDGSRTAQQKIVGSTCLVTSSEVTDKFGLAEVKIDGPPIIIDVRAENGAVSRKGDFAQVVEFNEVTRTYLIRPIASRESQK